MSTVNPTEAVSVMPDAATVYRSAPIYPPRPGGIDAAAQYWDGAHRYFFAHRGGPGLHLIYVWRRDPDGTITPVAVITPPEHFGNSGFVMDADGPDLVFLHTGHNVDSQPQSERPNGAFMARVPAGLVPHPGGGGVRPLPVPTPGVQSFSDVPPTAPFWAAVEACHAAGLISGYGDGTFRPNAPITRGQVAAMFMRYAAYLAGG